MINNIRKNKKLSLLAFLLSCIFIISGFIGILSWVALIPIVIILFYYDWKYGSIFKKSTIVTTLDICVYILCCVEVICCATSVYKPNSITTTFYILSVAGFYFFIRTFIIYNSQIIIIFRGISLFSGFIALMVLIFFKFHASRFHEMGFSDLTPFRQYYRPFGMLSNDMITILLCLLPFTFSLIQSETEKKWKGVFVLCEILIMTALLVGFSRGAYIAALSYFFFIIVFTVIFNRNKWKNTFLICALTLILPLVTIFFFERKSTVSTFAMNRNETHKRSTKGRFIKWREAIEIFKRYPLTGVGGGNYAIVSKQFGRVHNGLFTTRTTNTFLQILAEKGILGVIAYSVFFIALLYAGFRNIKNDTNRIPLLAALLALGIREMTFSSVFQKEQLLMLFVLIMFCIIQPVRYEKELL